MIQSRRVSLRTALAALLVGIAPAVGISQERSEDVIPGVPFQEGDVISFDSISKLKDVFLLT